MEPKHGGKSCESGGNATENWTDSRPGQPTGWLAGHERMDGLTDTESETDTGAVAV